jgi:acetoacetate decarboxylase
MNGDSMKDAPMSRPGDVVGWPKLVIKYRTDPLRLAALVPPGLVPGEEPVVTIGIYCVPVNGEPELGVSTKVPASFGGTDGQYTLGIGIDQESAIFISRETNGQPKFPCTISYFRLADQVVARCSHQGYTFLEYSGISAGAVEPDGAEHESNEWWIKYSRAVGGVEKEYDFPPHVVQVHMKGIDRHIERLDGDLTLRDSPWDPYTALLPVEEFLGAELVTTQHTARSIQMAEPLDPDAFWPHADTIGGSRWPGERGAPMAQTYDIPR